MSLKKLTNSALADEIGELARKTKYLTEQLDAAKTEFKDRGLQDFAGLLYSVHQVPGQSSYLDKVAVLDKLGQKWVDKHSKTVSYVKVVARALASARLKAVA